MTNVRNVLLVCGVLSSLLYLFTDMLGGLSWEGYSFLSRAFSDLPSLASPVRQLVLPFIVLRGVILFAFALGVWVSAKKRRALQIAALMLIGDNVTGLITPIYFPPPSSFHAPLTGVEVIFLLLAMAFGAFAFRKWFRIYSMLTVIIIIATGIWTFNQVSQYAASGSLPWLGIIERILIYGYLLWVAVLAVVLLRAEKGPTGKH